MKRSAVILLLVFAFSTGLYAQQDSTKAKQTPRERAEPSNVFYGGQIGLNFGDYFRIKIAPLVGWILNPKSSVGVKVAYEYINDKRYDPSRTYHNYGGSVFYRYRIIPQVYAHAEFAYASYQYSVVTDIFGNLESERKWIPFLLLGAGYVQPISPRTSLFIEVLFDVLQNENSPYEKWDPWVSIGVGVVI
jgi:hypothetical protein